MGDLTGQFQFVPETLYNSFVSRNIRIQELQRHLFLDFFIEDFVHFAHSASAQFLQDLVSPRKNLSWKQLDPYLMGVPILGGRILLLQDELGGTFAAEIGILRIFKITFGAFHACFSL